MISQATNGMSFQLSRKVHGTLYTLPDYRMNELVIKIKPSDTSSANVCLVGNKLDGPTALNLVAALCDNRIDLDILRCLEHTALTFAIFGGLKTLCFQKGI